MAGVEDEDEFKDALAPADPPPSSPSPASKPKPAAAAAGGGGGGGLGRRFLASIPLPASLSAAIGRFSSPKPPASNVGLGLLLHAAPAPPADDSGAAPASDAASGIGSPHPPPLASPQRQHGEGQVAGPGAGVGEEELGLAPAVEQGREKEGAAVDGCSANRNDFSLRGQEEKGEQCQGDDLGAAVDDCMVQDQEVAVAVVEQEEATEDCTVVVEDQSNNALVEQCAGDETRAVEDDSAVEVNEEVTEQEGAVSILAAEDGVAVGSQEEEDVVLAEQGEDFISVQDQLEVVEQCTGDQLRTTTDEIAAQDETRAVKCTGDQLNTATDDNAARDQEVVGQEGATKYYAALEAVEECTNDGSRAAKDGNIVEETERAVKQEGAVGVLNAAKDSVTVESQEEDVVVAEQGEDDISVQDQHKVVEQCTSDQLRTTMDDNAAQDQEVLKQEGATKYYTALEAVEECTNDGSRAAKDGNIVEEMERAVKQEGAVGVLNAAKDNVTVELQEEDVVVAEQGEDDISVQDQHKVVEQCTSDQLRTTMDDNAAEGQEVIEQEGSIVDRDATTDDIAVEGQEKEVKQSAGDESRATKDENAVEVNEKVVDQEDVIDKHGVIKDGSGVELLEENSIVEQGRDGISLPDEQYTSYQWRATTDDNAAENQEVVEQEGAFVARVATTDGIAIEDQEKEVEQSAGDESNATKDGNGVEDNEVDQEDVIDKQGVIKDGSGVKSQEEDMVVAEEGEDGISVRDVANVVEQCTSDQLRATTEDNAGECQEVVKQEGAIVEMNATADAITVEDQDKEVEQSAGDESTETKDENAVEDNERVVDQEDAIDKQGTAKDGSGVESQEEDVVVAEQGRDGISVRDEGNVVEQCTSDQPRTTDNNATEDQEAVEQGVVSILSAAKVDIVVELREEDIVMAEQVEDGVSVQDQDKVVEQCTIDQLRTSMDGYAVEDQEATREKIGFSAGYPQRPGKLNCRFYMLTGSCSYGSSCHFNHPQLKAKLEVSSFPSEQRNREVEFLELNRVGLPIREGARKCTYYMRNGTCRYGKKCCFNHPEQVLDVQLHMPTGWDDTNLQYSPHSKKSAEHATIDEGEHATISPGSEILPQNILRMLLPPQNVPPCTEEKEMKVKKDPDWPSASDDSDGCCSADSSDGPLCKQEHADHPERPECPFLLRFGNCKFASSCQYYHPKDKIPSRHHPKDKFPSRHHQRDNFQSRNRPKNDPPLVEELKVYPDKSGGPECPFYMKTGFCKFGADCKFHHPKNITPSMQGPASPKRVVAANEHHPAARIMLQDHMYQQQKCPERPGQPDCLYYMQFGKCKFQSACIFNHPKDRLSSGWHLAECPFYMKTGTCQFGSACEFYHPKDRCSSTGEAIDDGTDYEHDFVTKSENFLQQQEKTTYPERPGELECSHYMKHGYCKFQMSCKFHHPTDRGLSKK